MHFRLRNTSLKSQTSVQFSCWPRSPPAAHPWFTTSLVPLPCSAAGSWGDSVTPPPPAHRWSGLPLPTWHVASQSHSPLSPATQAASEQKHLVGALPTRAPSVLCFSPPSCRTSLSLAKGQSWKAASALFRLQPLAQEAVSWNKISFPNGTH